MPIAKPAMTDTRSSNRQRTPPTLSWQGDAATGALRMIDQTLLPGELREIDCDSVEIVREAIRSLRVRGAVVIRWKHKNAT